MKKNIKVNVIEVEKHVASLQSCINAEVSRQGYFQITPRFCKKSSEELRREQSKNARLIKC